MPQFKFNIGDSVIIKRNNTNPNSFGDLASSIGTIKTITGRWEYSSLINYYSFKTPVGAPYMMEEVIELATEEAKNNAEKARKKAIADQRKLDKESIFTRLKKVTEGMNGNCFYAYRDKDKLLTVRTGIPCYGTMVHLPVGITELVVNTNNFYRKYEKGGQGQLYKDWVKYVVFESPWKDCFLRSNLSNAITLGVKMNLNKSIDEVVAAAMVLRNGHEYDYIIKTWGELIKAGVRKDAALVVAYMYRKIEGNYTFVHPAGQSALFSMMGFKDLCKFMKQGYAPHNRVSMKNHTDNLGARTYRIFGNISHVLTETNRGNVFNTFTEFLMPQAVRVNSNWDIYTAYPLNALVDLGKFVEKEIA